MPALREILAEFDFQIPVEKLEHANKKVEDFVGQLGKIGKAVGAAFAIKEIWEFAETTARAINAVETQAHVLGVTTQAVQKYQYAAEASGNSSELLISMMGRLQVSASRAAKGGGEVGGAFKRVGLDLKNIKNLKADELFLQVADGISKIENPTERAGLAVQLWGRAGRQLLPFLEEGREGIEKLIKEFDELGGGFDNEAVEKSKDFEHSVARMSVAWNGVRSTIVHGLFPPLTWIVNKIADGVGWLVRMNHNTDFVRNSLVLITTALAPMAISMAAAFAPLLLAVAAATAVAVAFDDIVTFLQGGDSVIGDWVDDVFGRDTHIAIVKEVKEEWRQIGETWRDVIAPNVKVVVGQLKWIVDHTVDLAKALGRFGGYVGDRAAQFVNKVNEATGTGAFADMDVTLGGVGARKGRNKYTFSQTTAFENAKRVLEARQQGVPAQLVIPKGEGTPAQYLAGLQQYIDKIENDKTGAYAQFRPQMLYSGYGAPPPAAAPAPAMSMAPTIGTVAITVNGANKTNDQVGQHIAQHIKTTQDAQRHAKYVLGRAVSKPGAE